MTAETAPAPTTDPMQLALLRNDLRGLSRDQIGQLVAALTERMGVDPSLAPIDLIADKQTGALRVYINARGAAELAKTHDLSDAQLDIDVRERVVIVQIVARNPATGRTRRDVGANAFDPDNPASMARAIKSATTSAHRRVTLGMVGIFLNEPADMAVPDAD